MVKVYCYGTYVLRGYEGVYGAVLHSPRTNKNRKLVELLMCKKWSCPFDSQMYCLCLKVGAGSWNTLLK